MASLRLTALLCALALTSMATGCATVTGGTTQTVSVKTQKAAADMAGADCVLTNSKGSYELKTPGNIKVHRAKDDLNVRCAKAGESDATTTVQSSTRKGAFVAGNLVMFGVVGSLIATPIDHATGAQYAYPDDITVSFGNPQTQQPVAKPDAGTESTVSTNAMPKQSNQQN
ncbi:hypothetical protein [Paraburkholderia sp. J67]|uniref:hypothetical protein n=1 Tax=Paraburkholderia sp. J67 TaxID=2805435 RepID=UPI002ABE1F8B|nr:hypothetical protein [Paraburkholderia sp. J67]